MTIAWKKVVRGEEWNLCRLLEFKDKEDVSLLKMIFPESFSKEGEEQEGLTVNEFLKLAEQVKDMDSVAYLISDLGMEYGDFFFEGNCVGRSEGVPRLPSGAFKNGMVNFYRTSVDCGLKIFYEGADWIVAKDVFEAGTATEPDKYWMIMVRESDFAPEI